MALHFPSRLFKAKRASSSSSLSTIKSLVSSSSSLSKSDSMSSSSSTRRHDLDLLYLSFFFVRAENCMRASVDYWLGDSRLPKLTENGVTFSDLLPLFHSDFNNNIGAPTDPGSAVAFSRETVSTAEFLSSTDTARTYCDEGHIA